MTTLGHATIESWEPEPGLVERLLVTVPRGLVIAGSERPAADGTTFTVHDPATGSVVAEVANATVADGLAALAAADTAFATFRHTPPRRRADVLRTAHDILLARCEEIAAVITLEMGKPLAESAAEVSYAAQFFRWYAEEAVRVNGRFTNTENGVGRVLTTQSPVGPCLFVTPWNFPLAMGARKIAPALAAGCTCVVKPAAQTPLSMLLLADVLAAAGAPRGAVNVVPTNRSAAVVDALLEDARLRKLSFTGSTAVGAQLLGKAGRNVLRASMELGGNAPFLVFGDADLDAAIDGAMIAKLRNGGEACTAANRFLVHESVLPAFGERLTARLASLRVGHGLAPAAQLGPLIDERQRDAVARLVAEAEAGGATAVRSPAPLPRTGWFHPATVVTGVDPGASLLAEEIFGPVAPLVPFTTEDEAVTMANDTLFGLASYVYTTDLSRAFRVSEALEAGMVAVNQGTVSNVAAPFGGVKRSGLGREGGPEGMLDYLETKYVALGLG